MKPVAMLILSTSLFLMGAASPPPVPAKGQAGGAGGATKNASKAKDPAAAQLELQADAAEARRQGQQLLALARQAAANPEVSTILRNQGRLAGSLGQVTELGWMAVALLAVTLLVNAGGLWRVWRLRNLPLQVDQGVAALGRRLDSLERLVTPDATEPTAGTSEDLAGGRGGEPVLPTEAAPDDVQPAAAGGGTPGSAAIDVPAAMSGEASRVAGEVAVPAPPVAASARHGEIARHLAKLRQDARRLAEGFADPFQRDRFAREFDVPLGARLERLSHLAAQGEQQLRERWLGPDLVTTIDALGRFYSHAVDEQRQGSRTGLAAELYRWLYDTLGPACRTEGWFVIDLVEPYVTQFDPQVHHAVGGRDVAGAEGRVVALRAVGRRDPGTGAVIAKAEVIVGR